LLSAYDLSGCRDKRLLDKAIELGDMLLRSFDNPSRMPVTRWDLSKAVAFANAVRVDDSIIEDAFLQEGAVNAILAEFASFGPEMTRLSQLTGDERYFDTVVRVAKVMKAQQNSTNIPGLWPVGINARLPDLSVGSKFGLGSMADSAYEYLIKMYALLGDSPTGSEEGGQAFAKMYNGFVKAAVKNGMFFRPVAPGAPDVLFPGNLVKSADKEGNLPTLEAQGSHLACFVGGMLMLGGKLLQSPNDIDLGIKVTEGCVWAYNASRFGIMPERFHLKACDNTYKLDNHGSCDYNEVLWEKEFDSSTSDRDLIPKGFTKLDEKAYMLRPEAIESVFYAWRFTGEEKYRDMAWNMFESIEKWTVTDYGNAALVDVTIPEDYNESKNGKQVEERIKGPKKMDSMESFWMAETLKYLYLIYSDPNLLSLDEWVLNTEAHPFRRPGF
jgi:mannosyl-oligosaccharide alpha-1,2-mannosidase